MLTARCQNALRGRERAQGCARAEAEDVPHRQPCAAATNVRNEAQGVAHFMYGDGIEICLASSDAIAWVKVKSEVGIEADRRRGVC